MTWYVSVIKYMYGSYSGPLILITLCIKPDIRHNNGFIRIPCLKNYPRKRITARLLNLLSSAGYISYTTPSGKEILKLGYKIELPLPPNFIHII